MASKFSKRVIKAAGSLIEWGGIEAVKEELRAAGSKNASADLRSVFRYLAARDGSGGDADFEILVSRLRLIGGDSFKGEEFGVAFATVQCELRVRGYFEEAKARALARSRSKKAAAGGTDAKAGPRDEFSEYLAARLADGKG